VKIVKLVDSGACDCGRGKGCCSPVKRPDDFRNKVSGPAKLMLMISNHFYVTDAADRFAKVAERFFGSKAQKLEAIEVYGTDELKKGKVKY
jgi:hypothetical protein